MAEARSAVAELRVTQIEELEGRDSWKDFIVAWRKSIVRRYFRTRNSIRNGMWPTSLYNLGIAFAVFLILLFSEPSFCITINKWLWNLEKFLHLPKGLPLFLRMSLIAWIAGVIFFFILMFVRQYLLRILLTYRGWMYEMAHSSSVKTILWGVLVRLVSGYQPSLYSCQKSLPRLPVPPLRQTLIRVIDSLRPLCNEEEIELLKKESKEFEKTVGPKLQNILVLKSWWNQNYITDWWEKYVYLKGRTPLSINSNYYCIDHSYWAATPSQISRASGILYHILKFKRQVDREELEPLVVRGTVPICMAQYERILSTVRVPGDDIDDVIHYESKDSKHIIVVAKGIYYKLDVYDSSDQILSATSLETQIKWILEDAEKHSDTCTEDEKCIANLTALERSDWARIRKQYFTSGINHDTMKVVDKAILVMWLPDYASEDFTARGKFLLHGDEQSLWFDKSFNLIVFKNGRAGMNCEHSIADAPTMSLLWEYVMTIEIIERVYDEKGNCLPLYLPFRQAAMKRPQKLVWEIQAPLGLQIQQALKSAQANNSDLDLFVVDHVKWGKGVIKKFKVSPDAFIQLALQLSYFKDFKKFALTYEASMTRLYLSGRTETVRSCTVEATAFVRAMVNDDMTKEEKIRLLRIAADKHQNLYRDAMNGKGVDRHLFGLYVACKGLGYESNFLNDIISRPWTLSTSQQPQQQQTARVPDSNLEPYLDKFSPGGGFGPVSDQGYGVSYMVPNNFNMFFHISSKHSAPGTNSKKFANYLFESLEEMKELFDE